VKYNISYVYQKIPTFGERKIDGIERLFSRQKPLPQIEEYTGNYYPMKSRSVGNTQSIYSEIGVGIYQGEVKDIRRWAFSNPPQWMIGRLTVGSLNQIPVEYPKLLRYLACLLEQYHKQPDSWKNYLQTKGEIKLKKCSLKFEQQLQMLHPLTGGHDFHEIESTQQPKKQLTQSQLEDLVCSECPLAKL
jgi:hypothetical protein